MKAYGVVEVSLHAFMTSELVAGEWLPPLYSLRERGPGIHWIGGWVGPRAGLDTLVKRKVLSFCSHIGQVVVVVVVVIAAAVVK